MGQGISSISKWLQSHLSFWEDFGFLETNYPALVFPPWPDPRYLTLLPHLQASEMSDIHLLMSDLLGVHSLLFLSLLLYLYLQVHLLVFKIWSKLCQ